MTHLFFAKLHPLLVHFPVALLTSGALLELYGKSQHDETIITAGRFNLRLGFWSALVVAFVGALGLRGLHIKQKTVLGYHIIFACATITFLAAALMIRRYRERRQPDARQDKKPETILYLTLLILGFLSVLATGYWGSELVYRFGVATPHPIE